MRIRRIETVSELAELSEDLARLHNATCAPLPNFRPLDPAELAAKGRADRRFPARLILLAYEHRPLGWVSVEPTWQAHAGGDLYPYVGGEIVLQPSAIPALDDDAEVQEALVRRALRELAARGKRLMEVVVPAEAEGLTEVYQRVGFAAHRRFLSLRAPVGGQRLVDGECRTRSVREAELGDVLKLHNFAFAAMHKAYGWQFVSMEDLVLLSRSAKGFDPRGIIVCELENDLVGYVVAMTDAAFNEHHSLRRGFFALGPLGLATKQGSPPDVSRALMLSGMAYLAAHGCSEAELVTDAADHAALAFYADLEFAPVQEWVVLRAAL
jgi:hypothetical protein